MIFTLVSSFSPDLAPDLAGILFVTVLVGGAGSIFGSALHRTCAATMISPRSIL
jgi:hypothetical protein